MNLTSEQLDICNENKPFVVRACPGSGKTFTIAHKVAKILSKWDKRFRGVAVLSFTNSATKEIEIKLKELNITIVHPHFIGTIDSFINKFIFRNVGHLELKCKIKPIIVGDTGIPWNTKMNSKDQFFDRISFDKNENILKLLPRHELFSNLSDKDLENIKKKFLRRGFVNQHDINYISMKMIQNKKYNIIPKMIKNRFDYVIIDEAQDVTDIQMEIINTLINFDVKIILFGDSDQSIFEFNHATPELFKNKVDIAEKNNLLYPLNTNFRSSQEICNFTYNLSILPSKSISSTGKSGIHPKLIYYKNSEDFSQIINEFLEYCKKLDIELNNENVAILSRSNKLLKEILKSGEINYNMETIWSNNSEKQYKRNFAKDLAYTKYLYANGEISKSFKLMQELYISIHNTDVNSINNRITNIGYFNFKSELRNLINLMPSTDKTIGSWIDEFNNEIKQHNNFIFSDLFLGIKKKYNDLHIKELFDIGQNQIKKQYHLSNIHQAKGKTFDAVMVILDEKGGNRSYKNLINEKIEENYVHEELRIIYVGITRPRKILYLVAHENQKTHWDKLFKGEKQLKLI